MSKRREKGRIESERSSRGRLGEGVREREWERKIERNKGQGTGKGAANGT